MNQEEWILTHGSGSLRRAYEENMAVRSMYLHERTAYEFGAGFECLSRSRVLEGRPVAEADCPATTETCWYARALRWRWPNRDVRVSYLNISEADAAEPREGLGLILSRAMPEWVPKDSIICAITAQFRGGRWMPVVNPC